MCLYIYLYTDTPHGYSVAPNGRQHHRVLRTTWICLTTRKAQPSVGGGGGGLCVFVERGRETAKTFPNVEDTQLSHRLMNISFVGRVDFG